MVTIFTTFETEYSLQNFSGKYRGELILDIGSGPVIYPVITASEWFEEIYLSDLSKANVEYQQKWIRGESEPMEYLMKEHALKDGKGYLCLYV